MKHQLLLLSAALSCSAAFAQTNPNMSAFSGANGASQGLFALPDGVEKVTAIDAQNVIVAQIRPDDGAAREYRLFQVKHVYAGGIAMLFNNSGVIPTAPFVSPGFAQGGQNNNGNFGGFNQGQQSQQNGGFFPQTGLGNQFGNQQGGLQFTPNTGRMQAFPQNQPGLTLGTPIGKFFVPGKITN